MDSRCLVNLYNLFSVDISCFHLFGLKNILENYFGVVLFIKIKIFAFDFISNKCIMDLEITNVNIEDATNSEPKDLKLIYDSLTKSRLSIVYRRIISETPSTDEDVYICVTKAKK